MPSSYVSSVNGATGAITNVAKTNTANTFTTQQTISTTAGLPLDIDYDSGVSGFMRVSDDDNQATTVFKTAPSHNTGTITFPESGTLATNKYMHNVFFTAMSIGIGTPNTSVAFKFATASSTVYGYNSLPYALYSAGFNSSTAFCPASGLYGTSNGSTTGIVIGVFCATGTSTGTSLTIVYLPLATTSSGTMTVVGSIAATPSTATFTISSNTTKDMVRETI